MFTLYLCLEREEEVKAKVEAEDLLPLLGDGSGGIRVLVRA